MKKINADEIKKLYELSYISYTEKDILDFIEMVNIITNDIEEIKEINTDGIEPAYYPIDKFVETMREDDKVEVLKKEEVLKNAPEKDNDFIKIVKVV